MATPTNLATNNPNTNIKMLDELQVKIDPPRELRPESLRFFRLLVGEKTSDKWSPNALTTLCDLADLYVTINEQRKLLDEEGLVILAANGNPVRNPRFGIVSSLRNEIIKLNRFHRIDPSVTGAAEQAAKRAIAEAIDDLDPDDLLA